MGPRVVGGSIRDVRTMERGGAPVNGPSSRLTPLPVLGGGSRFRIPPQDPPNPGCPMFARPPGSPLDPRVRSDEFLELTWEMFGELCRALALRVGREYRPEVVVGIARAGVIPGAILASLLRVDFYSMKISRREGAEQVRERPAILSAAPPECRGKRVVIMDEIATSGETLRMGLAAVRDVGASEIRTATTFVRPQGYRPDYYALETDATLIFPWDRKIFDGQEWVVNPRYADVIDE